MLQLWKRPNIVFWSGETMSNTNVNLRGKAPSDSAIEMAELVLPNDTNLLGNLMGGRLMHWMDIAGALTASRHSNKTVATVSMDGLVFTHPIRMGEMVMLKAKITYVGKTSMLVHIKVFAENLKTGSTLLTNEAHLTFVALDDNGMPSPVPPLLPQTEEEIEIFKAEQEKRKR